MRLISFKKIKKSKLNKQMQKSRNGDGKALVLSLFWRKCLYKSVQCQSRKKVRKISIGRKVIRNDMEGRSV